MYRAIIGHLISVWRTNTGASSVRACSYTIGAVILVVTLGAVRPAAPPDSGIAGCAALSGARNPAASAYPRIRAHFAGSHRPDLRAAGTSYVDLIVELRTARGTDGSEVVWFYERLAGACARAGRNISSLPRHPAAAPASGIPARGP